MANAVRNGSEVGTMSTHLIAAAGCWFLVCKEDFSRRKAEQS